jgi:hypothetical protein
MDHRHPCRVEPWNLASRQTMRFLTMAVLIASIATEGNAQIRRGPGQGAGLAPGWMASASIGLLQPFSLSDGSTGSDWDFGSAIPLRIAVERVVDGSVSLGFALMGGSFPLRYRNFGGNGCPGSCDADAAVKQLAGFLHAGGGAGFSQIFELTAGVTGFSDFEVRNADQRVGPTSTDWDATFGLGYGISYGIGRSTEIQLVQELFTLIHQRTGLSGNANTLPRIFVTRIGGRVRL